MTYLDRKEKKLQAKAEPVNFIVQVRRSPGLAAAFARALGCWNGPLALIRTFVIAFQAHPNNSG